MSYLTNQILRGAETIRRNSREEWKGRAEKAEAEVERLKKLFSSSKRARASLNEALDKTLSDLSAEIANRKKCCLDGNQISDELFDTQQKLKKAEAEVERLKALLNRAINEIEKTPFHTPKLTAFTAHRLADRYREKMTNTSTKPIESQEDDK